MDRVIDRHQLQVIKRMNTRLKAAYRTLLDAMTRLVGGEPMFDRRERLNRPYEISYDVLRQRRRRQPWLSALFIAILVVGLWYPVVAMVGVLAMLVGAIFIGFFMGRYWCNWLCPRGSFFDSILRRISRGKNAPAFFHHPLFRLGWIAWFGFAVVSGMLAAWGDLNGMSAPFVRLMLISTAIAILLGIVFHERAWCMFCPMGTMGNVANRIAKRFGRGVEPQVTIDADACIDCLRCQSACRQQIKPNEHKHDEIVDHGDVFDITAGLSGDTRAPARNAVDHDDCLRCGYCVDDCPTGALEFEGASAFNAGLGSSGDD